jgi:hypothetical protein
MTCRVVLQVTTTGNRRLLEVTAKYEVLINTTDDTDASALSTVTEVLQNVTRATQVEDPSDIAWCGDFCTKHAESIDLQQTGEQTPVIISASMLHITCRCSAILFCKHAQPCSNDQY